MSSMRSRKTLVIGVTVNLEHYENLRIEVSGEVESTNDADDLAGYLDEVLGRLGREDQTTADRIDSYRSRVLARAYTAPLPAAAPSCHDGVCPLPADLLSVVPRPASSPSPAAARRTQPAPGKPPGPLSSTGGDASGNPPPGHPVRPVKTTKALPDSSGDAAGGSGPPRTGSSPATMESSSGKGPEPFPGRPAGTSGKTPSRAGEPPLSSLPASSGIPVPGSGEEGSTPLPEKATILTADTPQASEIRPLPPGGQVCDLCSARITEAERKTSQLFTSKNLCRACMKRT